MITAITGATGHIGANLTRALLKDKRQVRALIHNNRRGTEGLDIENSNSNFVFTFTITVLMKDYKYKYTISNYKYSLSIDNTVVLIGDYLLNTSCPVCDARAWSIIKKHVHTQTQNMITSLNESLVKTSEPVLSVN